MSIWMLLLAWLVLANLPWINDRAFVVFKQKNNRKAGWLRFVEVVVLYFIGLFIAMALETQYTGEIYQQDWEFFVTTFCLFAVFAVPGMVYRHQWLPIKNKR